MRGDVRDELYAIAGSHVLRYNHATSIWESELGHPDGTHTATALIEFNDTIFCAFGTDASYYYKESGGAWTAANITGANDANRGNRAVYFTKARNGAGTWALWKSLGTNELQWNTSPTDALWEPSSPFTVGDSNRTITNLYNLRDTFVVGKTDGLWIWNPTVPDFTNVTNEWDDDPSPETGRIGIAWHRDLFITAAQQGLFRYSFDVLEDLSAFISSPRLPDIGGRITAMASTSRDLLLALEQPKLDTDTTKQAQLIRLRLSLDGSVWQLHNIAAVDLTRIQAIVVADGETVWVFGTRRAPLDPVAVPRVYRNSLATLTWQEPTRDVASFADATAPTARSGHLDLSIWHGGVPATPKACLAMTIWGDRIDTRSSYRP